MDSRSQKPGLGTKSIMNTIRLTAATALIEFLRHQYVQRDTAEHRLINGILGIFGHGNVAGLGQALQEKAMQEGGSDQDEIKMSYIQPKNEQAMVHTAIAYSKAKRRLGTYACTTSVGPGATNLVTGAATATINRIPVLLLPGDVFSNRIPDPVLQQLEFPQSMDVSVNDCLKPVSKYWDRIHRPEQLLKSLPEAMRILADPAETGAVTICLPQDVQAECYDFPVHFFHKKIYRVQRPTIPLEPLAEALQLLKKSQRPMIIAGGGVHYSEAYEPLRLFAEATGVPVAVTQAGVGSLLATNPLCLGGIGVTGTSAANQIAQYSDLVLCIGTRLSDFTTASKTLFTHPQVRFINLNINAMDAHKHGALPLVCDASMGLKQLTEQTSFKISNHYAEEIQELKKKWLLQHQLLTRPLNRADKDDSISNSISQAQVIRVLNENLDKNSTIVHAAGGIPGDMHKLWQPKNCQDYHSEYGYSCMGYEIAGALGVKLAHPEREVYAFLGDGSYLMLNHEIVTSLQEGLKITIILIDNNGYQCIRRLQENCGSISLGNDFSINVDFVANAKSLGASTFAAPTEKDLLEALQQAKIENKTCLIYIPVKDKMPLSDHIPSYAWWDVPIAEVSQNAHVTNARQNYELKKKTQRFYY